MGREIGDFEKDVSWDLTLGEASPAGGYGMRSAFVGSVSWDFDSEPGSPEVSWDFDWAGQSSWGLAVGDVGTVSIVKIVSLSPRIEKLNSRS